MNNKDFIFLLTILFVGLVAYIFRPSFREEVKKDGQRIHAEREYQVIKIFENDGCTGYKFSGANFYSSDRYFVKCKDHKVTTSDTVKCGKSNCTEEIQTEPSSE